MQEINHLKLKYFLKQINESADNLLAVLGGELRSLKKVDCE